MFNSIFLIRKTQLIWTLWDSWFFIKEVFFNANFHSLFFIFLIMWMLFNWFAFQILRMLFYWGALQIQRMVIYWFVFLIPRMWFNWNTFQIKRMLFDWFGFLIIGILLQSWLFTSIINWMFFDSQIKWILLWFFKKSNIHFSYWLD